MTTNDECVAVTRLISRQGCCRVAVAASRLMVVGSQSEGGGGGVKRPSIRRYPTDEVIVRPVSLSD